MAVLIEEGYSIPELARHFKISEGATRKFMRVRGFKTKVQEIYERMEAASAESEEPSDG